LKQFPVVQSLLKVHAEPALTATQVPAVHLPEVQSPFEAQTWVTRDFLQMLSVPQRSVVQSTSDAHVWPALLMTQMPAVHFLVVQSCEQTQAEPTGLTAHVPAVQTPVVQSVPEAHVPPAQLLVHTPELQT
jgi:hypothetical protein